MSKAKNIKYLVILSAAVLIVVAAIYVTSHRISPLSWGWFGPINVSDGIALAGYDSVAYHTEKNSLEGKQEHRTTWKEVEWRFASEYNRELFIADPERYAPQYGGNCANAVSRGLTKKADPQVWFVKDDKLYVFAFEESKTKFINKIPNGVLEKNHESWARRTIQ